MGACLSCFSGKSKDTLYSEEGRTTGTRPSAPTRSVLAAEHNNLNKNKSQRRETWAKTGIVSLRDAGALELPKEALELGATTKVLDATNNRIAGIPPSIGSFRLLTRLVLGQNRISQLPAQIGQLLSLKTLVVEANALTSVPEELGNLMKLEKLNLARNKLRSLPASVGCLVHLKELNVSHNLLTLLPPTLGQCAALESLVANDNALLELPIELGALTRLKEANLDTNNIATVPSAVFVGCTSLQTLAIHGNPVSEEVLEAVAGYAAFRDRLKAKFDKQIGAGVLMGRAGLDDGLDHTPGRTKIVVPHI